MWYEWTSSSVCTVGKPVCRKQNKKQKQRTAQFPLFLTAGQFWLTVWYWTQYLSSEHWHCVSGLKDRQNDERTNDLRTHGKTNNHRQNTLWHWGKLIFFWSWCFLVLLERETADAEKSFRFNCIFTIWELFTPTEMTTGMALFNSQFKIKSVWFF